MGSQHSQIGLNEQNQQSQGLNKGGKNQDKNERGQQSDRGGNEEGKQRKPNGSSSNESLTFNTNLINQSTFSNSDSDNSSIFGASNRIQLSGNEGEEVKISKSGQQPSQQQQVPRQADLVNIVFTWNFGGEGAFLIGSFNQWKERIPMKKNGNEFTLLKTLERGIHSYKFVVDNEWRFAPDQPTMRDVHGNINNFIDTTHYAPQPSPPVYDHSQQQQQQMQQNNDRKESQPRKRVSDANRDMQSSYGQNLPNTADINQDAPIMPIHFQYNFLNRDDIPLHNEKYSKPLINKKATNFFDNYLDLPSHVILQSLTHFNNRVQKPCEYMERLE